MDECVRHTDRWYWLAVTAFLVTGLLYWEAALALCHLVCAARTAQLAIAARGFSTFAVQVNVVFVALVVAGNLFAPAVLFSAALLFAGTHAITGYCAIARLLALLPGNRFQPLSFALVKSTLCAPPMSGSILRQVAGDSDVTRA
ncbi:MAG: hypothetical protein OET44_03680 [Gammaproteobacteria bacterium]|nr:hypothetical protein [Gammaproteobacteria bacterium]